MDQDLPVGGFCPLHLASLAPAGTLSEAEPPRQGADRTLWLTLLGSLLAHAILLSIWATRPTDVKSIAPAPSVRITLNKAVTDTAIAETVLEQEPSAMEKPSAVEEPSAVKESSAMEKPSAVEDPSAVKELITPELPSLPDNTAATEVITQDAPRIDTRALDITPHHLPITSEPAPGNVFHPGLRGQIRGARARRERLHNTEKPELFSWRDATGTTWVDLGNGTCMRSASDAQGTTTGWELPTRCKRQLTEGESMLRSMQKTLDRR